MIDFPRSTFTWKAHPRQPDAYFRYAGGFVGRLGQVYHVRFNIEAACVVRDEASGHTTDLFLGAPCRTEYTIASRNLFQAPSAEWRMTFSRTTRLHIARRPSNEQEAVSTKLLSEAFQGHDITLRSHREVTELTTASQVVDATLANDLLNARSTYRDTARDLTIAVEYPINLININAADGEFQVCTGPVLLPDLETWDGRDVSRVFLAYAAFSHFDHVEFILRREVAAAESEREWLDQPRGRDRDELLDPGNRPPVYPSPRPRPTVFNETWALAATNVVLCAGNN